MQTRRLSGVVNAKITRTEATQNAQRPIDTQRAKGPIKTQRVKGPASTRGAQKAFAPRSAQSSIDTPKTIPKMVEMAAKQTIVNPRIE
jgi:hypothetical protein